MQKLNSIQKTTSTKEQKMKKGIYSVRDSVSEIFAKPFDGVNDEDVKRSFKQACMDEQTQLYQHPADFALFKLAEFNDSTGIIKALQTPELIMTALECIIKTTEETK